MHFLLISGHYLTLLCFTLSIVASFSLTHPSSSTSRSIITPATINECKGSNSALQMERRSVLVSVSSAAAMSLATGAATPFEATAANTDGVPRLWLDADPSGLVWTGLDCDDDLAILVALALQNRKQYYQLEGLSVCGGNAPLRHTTKDMQVLLRYAADIDDSPSTENYYPGYGWRSQQPSRKWLQQLNRLQPDIMDSNEATQAILDAASCQNYDNPQKLTVLTLGPPTNLAKALEQDPTLASRLEHVYMMGGELTNQRLDLNFASDRAAARTVVNANVPTTLIPIQLCAQVVLDQEFIHEFKTTYCDDTTKGNTNNAAAACALLPKMNQQIKMMPKLVNQAVAKRMPIGGRWIPSPNLDKGFIPWDIVAVLVISHPELFDEWEYHTVAFPNCAEGEPCDGTMVVQDLPRDRWPSISKGGDYDFSGIVRMPHRIRDETAIKALIMDLLGEVTANPQIPKPRIMLGFLKPFVSVATLLGGLVGGRFIYRHLPRQSNTPNK